MCRNSVTRKTTASSADAHADTGHLQLPPWPREARVQHSPSLLAVLRSILICRSVRIGPAHNEAMGPSGGLILALVSSCVAGAAGADIWQPEVNTTWQWQLQYQVNISFDVDMYDIDLFGEACGRPAHVGFVVWAEHTCGHADISRPSIIHHLGDCRGCFLLVRRQGIPVRWCVSHTSPPLITLASYQSEVPL